MPPTSSAWRRWRLQRRLRKWVPEDRPDCHSVGSQPGIRRQGVGRTEPGECADLSEEARAGPMAHPRQAQDDRRLGLEQETVADLRVERLDPQLERPQLAGDLGDEPAVHGLLGPRSRPVPRQGSARHARAGGADIAGPPGGSPARMVSSSRTALGVGSSTSSAVTASPSSAANARAARNSGQYWLSRKRSRLMSRVRSRISPSWYRARTRISATVSGTATSRRSVACSSRPIRAHSSASMRSLLWTWRRPFRRDGDLGRRERGHELVAGEQLADEDGAIAAVGLDDPERPTGSAGELRRRDRSAPRSPSPRSRPAPARPRRHPARGPRPRGRIGLGRPRRSGFRLHPPPPSYGLEVPPWHAEPRLAPDPYERSVRRCPSGDRDRPTRGWQSCA